MNRRERRQAKLSQAEPEVITHSVAATVPTRWRRAVALATIGLIVCAAVVGAWSLYSPNSKPAPRIIQGDGSKGPSGMMYVPGGEFLSGKWKFPEAKP